MPQLPTERYSIPVADIYVTWRLLYSSTWNVQRYGRLGFGTDLTLSFSPAGNTFFINRMTRPKRMWYLQGNFNREDIHTFFSDYQQRIRILGQFDKERSFWDFQFENTGDLREFIHTSLRTGVRYGCALQSRRWRPLTLLGRNEMVRIFRNVPANPHEALVVPDAYRPSLARQDSDDMLRELAKGPKAATQYGLEVLLQCRAVCPGQGGQSLEHLTSPETFEAISSKTTASTANLVMADSEPGGTPESSGGEIPLLAPELVNPIKTVVAPSRSAQRRRSATQTSNHSAPETSKAGQSENRGNVSVRGSNSAEPLSTPVATTESAGDSLHSTKEPFPDTGMGCHTVSEPRQMDSNEEDGGIDFEVPASPLLVARMWRIPSSVLPSQQSYSPTETTYHTAQEAMEVDSVGNERAVDVGVITLPQALATQRPQPSPSELYNLLDSHVSRIAALERESERRDLRLDEAVREIEGLKSDLKALQTNMVELKAKLGHPLD
ncbi:uncharacterized protein BDR25DRAFT_340136 [Lindgomyces ingoldianus]|uniref:Uncharacterized protein n=1 Tax=Lindgomyces ingoldianus TaxID=673940 RepID=A0ACB6R9D3_9PLEO|nr:uncharacterized protein BDR25DRAFT_340136 [Lindgomyces ingoldianus]KAF2475345.1 hypothetical protein BDR25DRAFT_340136 [Lindgomyces ingoldianus]